MLTRLRVQGFKNPRDLTVQFGPFTCIAGLNATGKSNLFDAIRFLHLLSQKPIMEAVVALRDIGGRVPAPEELFTRFGQYVADEMRFSADLLVGREVEDEFGVPATVTPPPCCHADRCAPPALAVPTFRPPRRGSASRGGRKEVG